MLIYLQMIETPEDRSKFEVLYLEYRDYMYRVAFAILNNPEDAEDAVHSAFVKIAENIQKIDDPKCLKSRSYIVIITRNAAIDIYRRKQNHPQVEYMDATIGISVEYDGDNDVTKCMLKLPEQYRSVLMLKHYYGYEQKEIAKILGITYQNVRKIEQRAKAKLRSLCEEEGILC